MPRRAPGSRPAFTLVELLVVIAIIGVLIAITLPGLAGARRQARATVGVANLRSLAGVLLVYTNDFKDQLLTPFAPRDPTDPDSHGAQWFDAVAPATTPSPALSWRFASGDTKFHTDFFAYYWYSFLADYHGQQRFREEQLSPADAELKALADSSADLKPAEDALWPSSFLYSPTMWSATARYEGVYPPMTADLLRANNLSNAVSASGKVMLWIRSDFAQAGPDRGPPAWNDPRAGSWVATVDGSCTDARVRDLAAAAVSTYAEIAPVALLTPPSSLPILRPPTQPAPAAADLPMGGRPAYFWATRHGIAGRDLRHR